MTELMRWDVINKLLSTTSGRRYLEIGVDNGECGRRVKSKYRWGVDPKPHGKAAFERFYCGTSDAFFEGCGSEEFDVVLVDGLHHAEQVYRDVLNALDHLAIDGAIVLHDCNPQSELVQRVPRQSKVWTGDCWKAIAKLRGEHPELDVYVIDTDEGLGIVTSGGSADPPLSLAADPFELTWADLESDRQRLLGLISAEQWHQRQAVEPAAAPQRVAVVTAIFGSQRDDLLQPRCKMRGHDLLCFTDQPLVSSNWQIEKLSLGLPPRPSARRVKALIHEYVDAEVVLWLDGSMEIMRDPRPFVSAALRGADMAAFAHPTRNCVYDEGQACLSVPHIKTAGLADQLKRYRQRGYPADGGLFATGVLVRRLTDSVKEAGKAWWREMQEGSYRDQVSLPYVLDMHGVECGGIRGSIYNNGFFCYKGHKERC